MDPQAKDEQTDARRFIPTRVDQCDLVMKGGITSGLVYPSAVARLSQRFTFRSIGGTSAGAIAAVATAAAQYGVNTGSRPDAFAALRTLPASLATRRPDGRSLLAALFAPDASTAPLMKIVQSLLRAGGGTSGLLVALLRSPSVWPSLAMMASIAAGLAWIVSGSTLASGLALVIGALSGGAFALWRLVRTGSAAVVANRFGLCSGMVATDETTPPLTVWIHRQVQDLAGRGPDPTQPGRETWDMVDTPENVLTFADLWTAFPPGHDLNGANRDAAVASGQRGIELVLMTTDLTRQVSNRLPFLRFGPLYIRKSDAQALFPPAVAAVLLSRGPLSAAVAGNAWFDHEPADETSDISRLPHEPPEGMTLDEFHLLPAPHRLPVLFGARLSMSFPLLLSAVPLYTPYMEKNAASGEVRAGRLVRCWFSDGGITSNFPIHFFDAALPSRPTFGLNLAASTARYPFAGMAEIAEDPAARVWMAGDNGGGMHAPVRPFGDRGGVGALLALGMAIVDTAREWGDTEQMLIPGIRDRVAHIFLDPAREGGLNLDMPSEVIAALIERGERAADLINARYANAGEADPVFGTPASEIHMTWDNHRWVRFRAFVSAYEAVGFQFARRYASHGYGALVDASMATSFVISGRSEKYPWANAEQRAYARQAIDAFVALSADLETASVRQKSTLSASFRVKDGRWEMLDHGQPPKPRVRLMTRPVGDADGAAFSEVQTLAVHLQTATRLARSTGGTLAG